MLPITALYVYLGMKLGENWEEASALFSQYMTPFVIVIIVGIAAYAGIKLFNKKRQKAID